MYLMFNEYFIVKSTNCINWRRLVRADNPIWKTTYCETTKRASDWKGITTTKPATKMGFTHFLMDSYRQAGTPGLKMKVS